MTKRGKQRRRHAGMVVAPPRAEVLPAAPPGGQQLVAFSVSASDLDAPREQYDADYAWVIERNGSISLFFGKGDAGRDGLLSRVEIRLSYEAFVGHYWTSSREFHAALRRQFRDSPLMSRSEREHRRPETTSPIKQHSLWANFSVMARHGTSASLDFYDVAPAAIIAYARTGDRRKLAINPVLRVNTTSFEVLRMLDASEPLIGVLEPLVGALEGANAEQ